MQSFPGFSKKTLEKAQQGDNPKAEQVKIFIVSMDTMELIQSTEKEASRKVDSHNEEEAICTAPSIWSQMSNAVVSLLLHFHTNTNVSSP